MEHIYSIYIYVLIIFQVAHGCSACFHLLRIAIAIDNLLNWLLVCLPRVQNSCLAVFVLVHLLPIRHDKAAPSSGMLRHLSGVCRQEPAALFVRTQNNEKRWGKHVMQFFVSFVDENKGRSDL